MLFVLGVVDGLFFCMLVVPLLEQAYQVYCLFAAAHSEHLDVFNASVEANRVGNEALRVFAHLLLDQVGAGQCAENGADQAACAPPSPHNPSALSLLGFLGECYKSPPPGNVLLKLTLSGSRVGSVIGNNLDVDAIVDAGSLLKQPPLLLVHLDWTGRSESDARIATALKRLSSTYPLALHRETEYLPLQAVNLQDVLRQRVTEILLTTHAHRQQYADLFDGLEDAEEMGGGGIDGTVKVTEANSVEVGAEDNRPLRVLACTAQWGNRNSPEMIKVFETYNSK
jgi:hypothetical protein